MSITSRTLLQLCPVYRRQYSHILYAHISITNCHAIKLRRYGSHYSTMVSNLADSLSKLWVDSLIMDAFVRLALFCISWFGCSPSLIFTVRCKMVILM